MRRYSGCFAILFLLCANADLRADEPRVFRTPLFDVQVSQNTQFELKFPSSSSATRQSQPANPASNASATRLEELPSPATSGVAPAPQNGPRFVAPSRTPSPSPTPYVLPSTPVRPMTHREFAASFRPAPGNYEVVLLHPCTHCAVKVCFTLPPGCIRKIDCDRNDIEFDYGKYEVELNFKRDGRVEVDFDD